MRYGKKWVALSSTLLVSCILSSCQIPRQVDDMLGEERTLPEDAVVNFGRPHRPILNPMNNYPAPSEESQNYGSMRRMPVQSYDDAPRSRGTTTSMSGRHIPAENLAMLSGDAAPETNVAAAVPVAAVPTTPVAAVDTALNAPAAATPIALSQPAAPAAEPEKQVADTKVPASEDWGTAAQSETPVAAATPAVQEPTQGTLKLTPPSSPKPEDMASASEATPTTTAAVAEAPAPAASDAAAVVQAAATAEQTAAPAAEQPVVEQAGYPTLASVPDAPERTSASAIASDIKTLGAEHDASQTAGESLRNNASSTVMTSPATGELVANAAQAVPATDLTVPPAEAKQVDITNEVILAEELAKEKTVAATATQPVPTQAEISAAPAAAAAPAETPAAVMAPATTDTAAATSPTPLMSATPASTTSADSDVVHLRAPTTIAETTTAAVPAEAEKQATDAAVATEEQPAAPKVMKMLPESRYAAKRHLAPVNESY